MCSSGPEKEGGVLIPFKIFLFHFLEETDIFETINISENFGR